MKTGADLSKVLLLEPELDFSFRLFRGTIFRTRSIFSKVNYTIFFKLSDSKIGTRVTYCESLDEFLCAKVEI